MVGCFALAGSVCVRSGDGAEKSSGGHGARGRDQRPAVPAALCPQREGELQRFSLESPPGLSWFLGS